jgi:hypothetical protein
MSTQPKDVLLRPESRYINYGKKRQDNDERTSTVFSVCFVHRWPRGLECGGLADVEVRRQPKRGVGAEASR